MRLPEFTFYLLTYTKGQNGRLIREHLLNREQNNIFKWVFKDLWNNKAENLLDPESSSLLSKGEVLVIRNKLKIWTDHKNYDYRIKRYHLSNGYQLYSIQEFEKNTPWIFLEECRLTISQALFNQISNSCDSDTCSIQNRFSMKLNSNDKYLAMIQHYVSYKLKPTKYDYWINKRETGQVREAGELGVDYIG